MIANKIFRYNTANQWFKGNTHLHTTASDGGKTAGEVAELYAAEQYDFIFLTDHWVASDIEQSLPTPPLLILDGIELDGSDERGAYYHIICLGKTTGITREDGLEVAMQKARAQDAIIILAHPRWSGNTMDDATVHNFDGVEIYNHVCHWLNGKSDGLTYWDAMLKQQPQTLAIAADDAHLKPTHPGWNGGWIAINAPELSRDNVLTAIKNGNFYSSCGPEFKSITFDGEYLHIESSPVQLIRLVGNASSGDRFGAFDGSLLTEASFKINEAWEYSYIEIEDIAGKRAWSNTLFKIGAT